MRKLMIIIALLLSTVAFPQARRNAQRSAPQPNYSDPLASVMWFSFNTDDPGKYFGMVYLECDKNTYWLRLTFAYPFNVKELKDPDGRTRYGKYSVPKGKHMYMKLMNDEIITLSCAHQIHKHTDYYTSGAGTYKKYDIECFFKLSDKQIKLLNQNPVIYSVYKMRMELLYDVTDIKMFYYYNFKEVWEKLDEKKTDKLYEMERQRQRNANPLDGF